MFPLECFKAQVTLQICVLQNPRFVRGRKILTLVRFCTHRSVSRGRVLSCGGCFANAFCRLPFLWIGKPGLVNKWLIASKIESGQIGSIQKTRAWSPTLKSFLSETKNNSYCGNVRRKYKVKKVLQIFWVTIPFPSPRTFIVLNWSIKRFFSNHSNKRYALYLILVKTPKSRGSGWFPKEYERRYQSPPFITLFSCQVTKA